MRCSAGSSPSSIVRCMAWMAMDVPAPTVTCRRTSFSCRRRARKPGSSCCRSDADGIPGRTIRCSGRSTPTIFVSTATGQRFSQSARERPGARGVLAAAELPADRSGHQSTVGGNYGGRLAHGSDGQRRQTHRRGWQNPWPRDPNRSGGYQLDGRFADLQEQALGALLSHAQIQTPPPQRMLEDLAAFQRTLFTNTRVRALSDAVAAGMRLFPMPILRFPGSSRRARSCSRAPAVIVTAAPANPPRRRPWFVITISPLNARAPWTPCRRRDSTSSLVPSAWRATHARMRSRCPTAPRCVASVPILAARCSPGLSEGRRRSMTGTSWT